MHYCIMSHPKFNREPLVDFQGIPQFVDDESYVSAFGIQWLNHPETQLDSYTGSNITRNRMKRMFGPIYNQISGKTVLEAGCGAGRFTEILVEKKSLVTAVDLSRAVESNFKNNGEKQNLRIVKASIMDLPFDDEQFDIVFCPGVLQHTPNPKLTILHLFRQVKPGGWLIVDQYRYNLSSMLKTTWFLRVFLRRLNPEQGLKVTNWLVNRLLPLHRFAARYRFFEILLFRISPITSHYAGYPELSESDQERWARLATHDNLTDYHKNLTSIKGMKLNIANLNAINQFFYVMPYTIEVRCQKPPLNMSIPELATSTVVKLKGPKIQSG